MLPTIKFFKIGVNFGMVQEEGAAGEYYSPDGYNSRNGKIWNKAEPITPIEIRAIKELQEDLPLKPRPFESMASLLDVCEQDLFKLTSSFEERGLMRRFSAVLHHRRAAFKSNAMTVWRVLSERAEEVGRIMASSKWVTHCYERPAYPDIPFPLYDDSRNIPGEVPRGCRRDFKDNRDHRLSPLIQYTGIQENARPLFRVMSRASVILL